MLPLAYVPAPADLVVQPEEVMFVPETPGGVMLVCVQNDNPEIYGVTTPAAVVGVLVHTSDGSAIFIPHFGGLGLPAWFMRQVLAGMSELSQDIVALLEQGRRAYEANKTLFAGCPTPEEAARQGAEILDAINANPELKAAWEKPRRRPVTLVTFNKLADEWELATGMLPILQKKFLHPAYLAILAFGPPVVPFILRRLRDKPGHWFDALQRLTGNDFSTPYRNMDDLRAHWLEWGVKQQLMFSAEDIDEHGKPYGTLDRSGDAFPVKGAVPVDHETERLALLRKEAAQETQWEEEWQTENAALREGRENELD